MAQCRHIGCVMSHGAAAWLCCVRVIGTCVTYVACAGRATMTRRGRGGHQNVCRGTWVSSHHERGISLTRGQAFNFLSLKWIYTGYTRHTYTLRMSLRQ